MDDILVFFDKSRRFVCGHGYLILCFHSLPPNVFVVFNFDLIVDHAAFNWNI